MGDLGETLLEKQKGWSTGLLSCFDDLGVFIYGSHALSWLAAYDRVRSDTTAENPGAKVESNWMGTGIQGTDGSMCFNCCLVECFPCIYCMWRGVVRDKYQIDGSFVGDVLVACYCLQLGVMQDARELRIRGAFWPNGDVTSFEPPAFDSSPAASPQKEPAAEAPAQEAIV